MIVSIISVSIIFACTGEGKNRVQQPPQGEGGVMTDYSQLLSEGYVYDNERLVVARPNAAYATTGRITLVNFSVIIYIYIHDVCMAEVTYFSISILHTCTCTHMPCTTLGAGDAADATTETDEVVHSPLARINAMDMFTTYVISRGIDVIVVLSIIFLLRRTE